MIVVDTSAVVAVLRGEPGSQRLREVLTEQSCTMSAATYVELGIVVEAKYGPAGMQLLGELLDRVGMRVVDVDPGLAAEAMVSWRRFGKGRHRRRLRPHRHHEGVTDRVEGGPPRLLWPPVVAGHRGAVLPWASPSPLPWICSLVARGTHDQTG